MKDMKSDFKMRIEEIKELVKREFKPYLDSRLCLDGIINDEEYFNTDPKILWILKEPYGGIENELCDIPNELNKAPSDFIIGKPTWQEISYITWSIFNNFTPYNKIPDYWDNDHDDEIGVVADYLKKIAFINIKKIAGGTSSKSSIIQEYYNKYKVILEKQIKEFEPNIVILGGTLKYFGDDLYGDNLKDSTDYNDTCHFIRNGQLFIDAQHPAQRFSKEIYANTIIDIVKRWENGNRKVVTSPVSSSI